MNHLGLYLHIPFCRTKCGYCDFYSLPGCSEKEMDGYLDALLAHLAEFFPTPGQRTADTVYIGGGTPSLLGGKRIARLLKAVEKRVTLTRNCEITLEVNPESVDKALMKAVRAAGVNRVSMGVQSAHDGELKALGRLHTFAEAERAVEVIRKYCTDNISLDLMYGLPGQDMAAWQHSVRAIMALGPKHISCYSLKLEEGTPMGDAAPSLPEGDAQAEMYLWAVELLARSGWRQYEISNLAIPGYESRHNSRYWDLSEYVGLGCGAASYYGGRRFTFVADLAGYISGLSGRGSILAEADDAPFYRRIGEYLMLGLRTVRGVSEDELQSRFEADFAPYAKVLEGFVPSGHAEFKNDRWRLTPTGFLVSNHIIGAVLEAGECGE